LRLSTIPPPVRQIQGRLLTLAALFLGLYSLALTLSPAARARSWAVTYRWDHWLGFLIWLALFAWVHLQSERRLPERDPYLLPLAALLSGWGLLTIWRLYPSFGLRQALSLGVVLVVFIAGLRLSSNLAFLRQYKYVWLSGGLILTGLTLLLGTNPATGSSPRLWLGCCGFYLQPSEPLKLLLIVYLAAYLADHPNVFTSAQPGGLTVKRQNLLTLQALAPTLVIIGLTLLLLLVQRDLGTATIFIFLYTAIIFVATGRARIVLISALTLAAAGLAGYALFDVVRLRVDAWLNPWLDPSGRSYQIVQSLIAVANGGLVGRGPGLGNPTLVPVSHSDFIFTAIVEESGLLGAIALVVLLALLAVRGLQVAIQAPDRYRRYLASGLTAYLIGQSVLIAGGNLRLLPLTGVTLPFVSYGGSSLLTAFLSLLILLHISNHARPQPAYAFNTRPYLTLGAFLLLGLGAVGLGTGWWAYYRGPALVERTDNARRAIADRYVPRGSILDRHGEVLADTAGSPGDLTRQAHYAPLGAVLGYVDPVYGLSGLEAGLDPYLRGLQTEGLPARFALAVWWNHLLYGQPPPGLDVRLSLDLASQQVADQLLGEHASALVLLNSQSGEILALASHPTFDPNRLDQRWSDLIKDPHTPLLDRATLGRYPPGSALGAFLLAAALERGNLPSLPGDLNVTLGNQALQCASQASAFDWGPAIAVGCPAAQLALGQSLGAQEVLQLYAALGLYTPPAVRLPADSLPAPQAFADPIRAMLGQDDIGVSPLQMALAAATLSNAGNRPAPRLAMAVDLPQEGWNTLAPLGEAAPVFNASSAEAAASALGTQDSTTWQTTAVVPNGPGKSVSWSLAGTLPSWNGTPLTLVVLLEENNPDLAQAIAQAVLQAALRP
jgi:cell division protein FtsW (lipid II flippase)